MQKTLFIKLSIITGLCLLFAIALSMIDSLVDERQSYARSVVAGIAEQHVKPQQVITPFIVLPKTVSNCPTVAQTTIQSSNQPANQPTAQPTTTDSSPTTTTQPQACQQTRQIHIPIYPERTDSTADMQVSTDTYQRGIYHATSYRGQMKFRQRYDISAANIRRAEQSSSDANIHVSNTHNNIKQITDLDAASHPTSNPSTSTSTTTAIAKLVIPVSDLRGVTQLPSVRINGELYPASYPKTQHLLGLSYIEVDIPNALFTQLVTQLVTQLAATTSTVNSSSDSNDGNEQLLKPLVIDIDLPLSGISQLQTIPLGNDFVLQMHSNWHAPNFMGSALPNDKSYDASGFRAKWQNQYLAIANNQRLNDCLSNFDNNGCNINTMQGNQAQYAESRYYENSHASTDSINHVSLASFAVSFAEPNNAYLQTERTIKYALLLILISFATFFLFEVIKSLRIHPIQYLLVGCALLVFYVLLLSLAEYIVFWQAYLTASIACVSLIAWYAYYVLHSVARAALFAALLSSLYAGFYGILTVADMNLLLGAVFCFVLVAAVMVITRNIDWYQVS